MDDLEIGYVFIGIIIGIVIGALLSLIFSENKNEIKNELVETQNSLIEVTTERDIYKNLILEKSLEE